jgi:phosphatidylserine/phosphatidylglycerophosphate/cardiolipin synthase-like enzyme
MEHNLSDSSVNSAQPVGLKDRTLHVQPDTFGTVRLPFDMKNDSGMKWIVTWPDSDGFSKNNRVRYITSSLEAFRQMRKAMETAVDGSHFIYMINWWFEINLTIGGPDMKSLSTLMKEASDRGASIRCIFGGNTPPGSTEPEAVNRESQKVILERIPNGSAVRDTHGFLNLGDESILVNRTGISHHQKVLCVFGSEGLIAFCGGVDFNLDRIASVPYSSGSPLSDLHCRISGSAALSLLEIFRFRWKENREALLDQIFDTFEDAVRIAKEFGIRWEPNPLAGAAVNTVAKSDIRFQAMQQAEFRRRKLDIVEPDLNGKYAFSDSVAVHFPDDQWVQITKTFGEGIYPGLPTGKQSIKRQIVNAIRSTKRFIYTEDQYFVGNEDLQRELCAAVAKPGFRHLIVLVTHWRINDFPGIQRRRREFINALRACGGSKVSVFTLWPDKGRIICRTTSMEPNPDLRRRIKTITWSDESGGTMDPPDPRYISAYGSPFMSGTTRKQNFWITDKKATDGTYIHSKVWIFDDLFAIIGSANSNKRSWYSDSEIAAGIYDPLSNSKPRNMFARALRMTLWSKHLKLPESELADGVASAVHWVKPPKGSLIKVYDENEEIDFTFTPDYYVDPGTPNRAT